MPTPLPYNPNVANITAMLGAGGGMNPMLPYSTSLVQRAAGGAQRAAAGPRSTATANGVETASGGVSTPAYPGDPMAGTPLARVSQGGRGTVGPTTGGSPVLAEGPFAGLPFSADPANRVPEEGFASRPDFTDEQRMANYNSRMPTLMAFSYGNGIPGGGGLLGVQDSPSGVSFRPNPFDAVRAAQVAPLFARREAADKNAAELQRVREGNAAQLEDQRIQTEGNVQSARIQAGQHNTLSPIQRAEILARIESEVRGAHGTWNDQQVTAERDRLFNLNYGHLVSPQPVGNTTGPQPAGNTTGPQVPGNNRPTSPGQNLGSNLLGATGGGGGGGNNPALESVMSTLRNVTATNNANRPATPQAALARIYQQNPNAGAIIDRNWPAILEYLRSEYPNEIETALHGSSAEALWNPLRTMTGLGFEPSIEQQVLSAMRARAGGPQYGARPGENPMAVTAGVMFDQPISFLTDSLRPLGRWLNNPFGR